MRQCPPDPISSFTGASMKIQLERNVAGTFLLVAADGRDLLIQSDWDFLGTASTFGWVPCACGKTDSTVDCLHRTRSEMIAEAANFLDENVGMEVNDPGYFSD